MFLKYTLILSFIFMPLQAILSDDEGDPVAPPHFPVRKATSFDRVRAILASQRQQFEERGALHSFSTYLTPQDLTDENVNNLEQVIHLFGQDNVLLYASILLQKANFPKLPFERLQKFIHVIHEQNKRLLEHDWDLGDEHIEGFFIDYLPSCPIGDIVDYVVSEQIYNLENPYILKLFRDLTEGEDSTDPEESL